jgi:hypothetical protein
MIHRLRDPKCNGTKRQVKNGEPFDPEELSRRLIAHLAEQKLKADRRRDARAIAAQQNYHHVPKSAASAFERTATPDVLRKVHKLSQPAVNQHLEVLSLDDPNAQITSLQRTRALDRAVIERDMLRNRNQFQWDHDMEEAAEVDVDRDVYKPPQRTFNSEFADSRSRYDKNAQRPLSTGNIFWEEDEPPINTKAKPKPKPAFEGRNDWAQREEGADDGRRVIKEISSPFLRKKDSIWILKGRKQRNGGKDENKALAAVVGDFGSPPDGSKRGRSSFLARFKRHPS